MKKTEGKRTSVAEYVRKRACGESAGPGKEEVLPVCERSVQQEEVKSDLELLQACCKKEKYFLEMFRKASGSNVNDVRARVLKVQAFEQAIQALTGEKTAEEKEEPKGMAGRLSLLGSLVRRQAYRRGLLQVRF